MKAIIDLAIDNYATDHTSPEPALLKELVKETYDAMSIPYMISGPVVGNLLKLLVTLSQAKTILEIGMFTGYSALYMAAGLRADGRIITCDVDPKAESIARKYFSRSNYSHQIEIKMGPALETIKFLTKTSNEDKFFFDTTEEQNPTPLDFVFIDADKENYFNYFQAVLPLVKKGGLIVFDNALREGRVLNPTDPGPKAIDQVNKAVVENKQLENVFLTIRDGVNVVYKK